MQRAKVVLSILKEKSLNKDFIFDRLYRNFFNSDFYLYTFHNIHNEFNYLFSGENLKLNSEEINNLISRLRNQIYLSKEESDYFINNGISKEFIYIENIIISFLKIIYKNKIDSNLEKNNENNYYLNIIKEEFNDISNLIVGNYLIEKEILNDGVGLFLERKISDNRFIDLINRIIKFKFRKDKNLVFENDNFLKLIKDIIIIDFENKYFLEENIINIRVRDKFLIGFKEKYKDFRRNIESIEYNKYFKLNYEFKNLNFEKVEFLNYEINKIKNNSENIYFIKIFIPMKVINNLIKNYTRNNKVVHYGKRINNSVNKIIDDFIKEYENVYDYYSETDFFKKKIKKFKFYNYKSLLKTLARKEKTTVNKIIEKYQNYIDVEYKKIEKVNK